MARGACDGRAGAMKGSLEREELGGETKEDRREWKLEKNAPETPGIDLKQGE